MFKNTDGSALSATINGNPTAGQLSVTVEPQGAGIFTTSSQGDVNVGWARLQTDNPVGGSILFNLSVIGAAGVPTSTAQKEFIAPVERLAAGNINTGIAIANTENKKAGVTITLKDEAGFILATKTIEIAALAQTARFIDELFREVNTSAFRGSLLVQSDTLVAGTIIRVITGEMATLPVGSVVP